MAVDFSLLPLETTHAMRSPSWIFWAVVCVAIGCVGASVVILLWPKDMPTQTWRFWFSVVVLPVGISAFVGLSRYRAYESQKLDMALHNEAVRAFNARVFRGASMPLAVVGAAYRYSADDKENSVQALRQGSVVLATRPPIARNAGPVRARWLAVPGMDAEPGTVESDRNRSHLVTTWLFDELLRDLSPRIQALPSRLPLTTHLLIANGFSSEENKALWQVCWDTQSPRVVTIGECTDAPADFMMLDGWLDSVIEGKALHATLLVAVQLHPLLAAAPPPGVAEVGAAVLLLPDAMASRHAVPRVANLYRPVRGVLKAACEPLSTAFRWAGVSPARITSAWQTALDAESAGALREPAIKMGLTLTATDLDQSVGHAGIASPWLAIACASKSISGESDAHLIVVGQGDHVDCAVLNHACMSGES